LPLLRCPSGETALLVVAANINAPLKRP